MIGKVERKWKVQADGVIAKSSLGIGRARALAPVKVSAATAAAARRILLLLDGNDVETAWILEATRPEERGAMKSLKKARESRSRTGGFSNFGRNEEKGRGNSAQK